MLPARGILAGLLALGTATPGFAQDPLDGFLDTFEFRNLGPFRAGAWITDFAVPATPERAHLYTFYVGTRNGGVWKTENAGTTFEPIFDATDRQSIGAVAVAPADPAVLWVGTGESYVARYSYAGDGVYRSTDGGATWRHMGLRESQHIARIVVHPTDARTVFVAAMGPLHTRNGARGVFRSRDGGETWERVLFVDDQVGVIDMVMDPTDPDVLYAATYDKERTAWRLDQGGPGSGIWKTTDGGDTWSRLEGGLPTGEIGRIGIDVFRGDPDILYAVVENLNPRPEGLPQPNPVGGGMGEVYRSDDGGATWRSLSASLPENAPSNAIVEDPRSRDLLFLGTDRGLFASIDGGTRWTRFRANMPVVPVRDLVIHPRENDLIVGTHGRAIYATDITPLQQLTPAVLASTAHLFAPEPKDLRVESAWGNYALDGDHVLVTSNEPNGMVISYWLRQAPASPVAIRILDGAGNVVAALQQPPAAGLQQVVWNLRRSPQGGGRGGRSGGPGAAPVPPGEYTIVLLAGDEQPTQTAVVKSPVPMPRISAPNQPRR